MEETLKQIVEKLVSIENKVDAIQKEQKEMKQYIWQANMETAQKLKEIKEEIIKTQEKQQGEIDVLSAKYIEHEAKIRKSMVDRDG